MKIASLALAVCLASPTFAAQRCGDLKSFKAAIETAKGTFVPLTKERFQFLRGIWAMNPTTPAGLPYGSGAAVVTVRDKSVVVFTDDRKACDIMPVPQILLNLLSKVDDKTFPHEAEPGSPM